MIYKKIPYRDVKWSDEENKGFFFKGGSQYGFEQRILMHSRFSPPFDWRYTACNEGRTFLSTWFGASLFYADSRTKFTPDGNAKSNFPFSPSFPIIIKINAAKYEDNIEIQTAGREDFEFVINTPISLEDITLLFSSRVDDIPPEKSSDVFAREIRERKRCFTSMGDIIRNYRRSPKRLYREVKEISMHVFKDELKGSPRQNEQAIQRFYEEYIEQLKRLYHVK